MAVSDRPWDFAESDYSFEQWKNACLVDTGTGGAETKDRYKLPVREPDGTLNRNGCHAAAARLNQVQPASKRAAAARALISLYHNDLHEEPPDSLMGMSGERSAVPPTERLCTTSFSSGLRVEARSLPDGSPSRTIGGYAAVFGKRSHPMGGIREIVEPSFFNKSKADGWPMAVARFEHDPKMLLGTTAGKTLTLKVDSNGLDYSVLVPESRSDVWELAERGDLPGSSFSFQAYQDDWRLGDGGVPERHLVTGRLIDVAPTAVPAYPDATVKTLYRSLAMAVDADESDVEDIVLNGNARKLFVRTDNIDKRVKMEDSAQGVELVGPGVAGMPGINIYVNSSAPKEKGSKPSKSAPEPVAQSDEVRADAPEMAPAESEPEPQKQPEVVAAVQQTESSEDKPRAHSGLLDLMARRNRLRENCLVYAESGESA